MKEKEEEYRIVALHALGNSDNDAAVPVLSKVANDASPRVRATVVQMLGEIGTLRKFSWKILEKE